MVTIVDSDQAVSLPRVAIAHGLASSRRHGAASGRCAGRSSRPSVSVSAREHGYTAVYSVIIPTAAPVLVHGARDNAREGRRRLISPRQRRDVTAALTRYHGRARHSRAPLRSSGVEEAAPVPFVLTRLLCYLSSPATFSLDPIPALRPRRGLPGLSDFHTIPAGALSVTINAVIRGYVLGDKLRRCS